MCTVARSLDRKAAEPFPQGHQNRQFPSENQFRLTVSDLLSRNPATMFSEVGADGLGIYGNTAQYQQTKVERKEKYKTVNNFREYTKEVIFV